MDNGGENNKLNEILPKEIMYNCHPYCSGEKGTLENKHRIVRRVIPKGVYPDNYTDDIEILNAFINNYCSSTFNRIKYKEKQTYLLGLLTPGMNSNSAKLLYCLQLNF